ncbi:MAG: hypothetical protein WC556_13655 [Candidatus Methanoperedens sp.]
MSINPLDTLKEENNLLKLFDSIKGESSYIDLFNLFLEKEKNFKEDIYKNSDNCIKRKLNYIDKDIIILELNTILKPMKLKCTNDTLSCKEVNENNKKFKSNIKLMHEWVKIEPAFICRVCKPSKIFETEDELRKHREESGHKSKTFLWKIKKDKRLTIIENVNYIYTPTLELIDYSGILVELNEKLKSINLKLYVENSSCIDEEVAMLRFEPTFACYYCKRIYDTEQELKECEKRHEEERIIYQNTARISDEIARIKQAEHDKKIKGEDKTN